MEMEAASMSALTESVSVSVSGNGNVSGNASGADGVASSLSPTTDSTPPLGTGSNPGTTPFDEPILPSQQISSSSGNSGNSNSNSHSNGTLQTSPLRRPSQYVDDKVFAHVLLQKMQLYAREAEHILHVNIYQCECFMKDSNMGYGESIQGRYMTLPFLQRAELGLAPMAALWRREKQISPLEPLTTILKNRAFKYVPDEWIVRYNELLTAEGTEMLGGEAVSSALAYHSLQLVSVPRVGAAGLCAHPLASYLEMVGIDAEKAARNSKRSGGKEGAAGSGNEAVSFIKHVGRVEIEAVDKSKDMWIMLDGKLFGPFYKVCFGPMKQAGSEEIMTFPLMGFFPTVSAT